MHLRRLIRPRGPVFGLMIWLGCIVVVATIVLEWMLHDVGYMVVGIIVLVAVPVWWGLALLNGVWIHADHMVIVTGIRYRRLRMDSIAGVGIESAYVGWPLERLVLLTRAGGFVRCTSVAWFARQGGRIVPERQGSTKRRAMSQNGVLQRLESALER